MAKIGKNEPCPGGSGKKHKQSPSNEPETVVTRSEPSSEDLVVPFNFEPPAKLQADLQIPTDSMPLSFFLPGKFLLGDDYWNAAVEMVCVDSDSSRPESGLPFLFIAPSHREVWRTRIFHFSQDILLRAISSKTPFRLDLSTPSVPFVEIVWDTKRGFLKSIQGLQHVDPRDFQTVARALEKIFKRWSLLTKKRGRKPGAKTNTQPRYGKDDLLTAIEKAIVELDRGNLRPTRALMAKRLGFSNGKALYRLQKIYGEERNWPTIVREALKE